MVAMLLATGATMAQTSYKVEGNTYTAVFNKNGRDARSSADSTAYTYADSKGEKRPIWIARTGSCFVIRISSKTGNEYRQYLPREVSADICRRLGREYKPTQRKETTK